MGETTLHNDLTVTGNLKVLGTTQIAATGTVADKTITLNSIPSPTDANAANGGMILKAAANKNFLWSNTSNRWTSNIGIEATSFVKTSGTASQFLMADGSTLERSSVDVTSGKTILVDSIRGDDSRGSFSKYSQELPFQTIAAAVAISAVGDLIYIRAGDYLITTQITLNNKGNIYCEPGVNITSSPDIVAFAITANDVDRYIYGYANFICDGTGGVLSISTSSKSIHFEANSITNTSLTAGNIFTISSATLHIKCNYVNCKSHTIISNSTANSDSNVCYYSAVKTVCSRILNNGTSSPTSYVNISADDVEIWGSSQGVAGLTINGGNVFVKIANTIQAIDLDTSLIALNFSVNNLENSIVLSGGSYISRSKPCIEYLTSAATNKKIKLCNDIFLKTANTLSITSADNKDIYVSSAHTNKPFGTTVNIIGGTYIVDSNF